MKSRRFMGNPLGPGPHLTTSLHEPCVVRHSKSRGPMAEMGHKQASRALSEDWETRVKFNGELPAGRAEVR